MLGTNEGVVEGIRDGAIVGAPVGSADGAPLGTNDGATLGAAIGSVFPGPGTVLGGLIGGVAGYYGGAYLGRKLAELLLGTESSDAPAGSTQPAQPLNDFERGQKRRTQSSTA